MRVIVSAMAMAIESERVDRRTGLRIPSIPFVPSYTNQRRILIIAVDYYLVQALLLLGSKEWM
jgi:hypothetical protein